MSGGWVTPKQRGPRRRTVLIAIVLSLAVFIVWAAVINARVPGLGNKGTTTVNIELGYDGNINASSRPTSSWKSEQRTRAGVAILATRGTIRPRRDVEKLRLVIGGAPGVDLENVAVRVGTYSRRRITQNSSRDRIIITLVDPSRPVELLITRPITRDQSASIAGIPERGALLDLTDSFDERVQEAASDARLRARNRASWWKWMLAQLVVMSVFVIAWRSQSNRFFSSPIPADHLRSVDDGEVAGPLGPPRVRSAVDAALITSGVRGVDSADAFAAEVLERVDHGVLQMRRTLDPRVGSGALIGLAHAHGDPDEDIARNDTSDPQGATHHEARTSDIDDSVVAILESLTADSSSELAVPDSATRAQRMLTQAGGAHEQALVAWDAELHHREAQLAVVETAKWYVPRALAAALIVIGVIGVMSAVFIIDAPGRASSWWIVALCLFINAFVLERCARDMRRWRRVHRNWRVERAAWLEWRSHLGANAADPADVRNIPYAAATGNVENVARVLAAPSTVGLHAVTPQTISTLRLFGGAHGAE